MGNRGIRTAFARRLARLPVGACAPPTPKRTPQRVLGRRCDLPGRVKRRRRYQRSSEGNLHLGHDCDPTQKVACPASQYPNRRVELSTLVLAPALPRIRAGAANPANRPPVAGGVRSSRSRSAIHAERMAWLHAPGPDRGLAPSPTGRHAPPPDGVTPRPCRTDTDSSWTREPGAAHGHDASPAVTAVTFQRFSSPSSAGSLPLTTHPAPAPSGRHRG